MHQWDTKIDNNIYERGLIPSDSDLNLEKNRREWKEIYRLKNGKGEYTRQVNTQNEEITNWKKVKLDIAGWVEGVNIQKNYKLKLNTKGYFSLALFPTLSMLGMRQITFLYFLLSTQMLVLLHFSPSFHWNSIHKNF